MKRAALYARVSTPDQANTGTSLQSQLEACRAYATEQGYSVVMEAQDTYTGTTVTRTGLEGVMQAAREGALDAVICHKIDRSSRDLADLLLLDKQLQSCGVLLDFVQDRRDRTPQGDLFFQIKGAFAQYELDQIRYRTMTGKEQRVRNGAVLGSRTTAYGYTLNRATRNLDIDEERAPYVRLIYRWYTEGNTSLSEVARRLNALHAPVRTTAAHWMPQAVRDIIRNDVYRGLWAYNKRRWQSSGGRGSRERPRSEWLFVPVPALVSDEMWQRAQEMLERNAYYSRRNEQRYTYLLTGLLFCGSCGRRMNGRGVPGKTGLRLDYYACNRIPATKIAPGVAVKCMQRHLRAEYVEAAVWGEVARQTYAPDILEDALAHFRVRSSSPQDDATEQLRQLEAAMHRERQRLSALLDIVLDGGMDRIVYRDKSAEIEERLRTQEAEHARLTGLVSASEGTLQAVTDAVAKLQSIAPLMHMMDEVRRRDFLRDISLRVTASPDARWVSIEGLPLPAPHVMLPEIRRRRNVL